MVQPEPKLNDRRKVLSAPMMARSVAIVSVDSLELSIIQTAQFGVILSEIYLNFRKCHDAPFRSGYLAMIKTKMFRKKVKPDVYFPDEACHGKSMSD